MKNKKGQRRVALLVLILTLVLCLSTLLQGLSVFADAEVPSTDSENQTTQTQENTAQAQEESDSEQVQNEQNEAEAEGNSGEESEAQAVNTDVPQTAALTLSWANVRKNQEGDLYRNLRCHQGYKNRLCWIHHPEICGIRCYSGQGCNSRNQSGSQGRPCSCFGTRIPHSGRGYQADRWKQGNTSLCRKIFRNLPGKGFFG